jgi:hypothetical protein
MIVNQLIDFADSAVVVDDAVRRFERPSNPKSAPLMSGQPV